MTKKAQTSTAILRKVLNKMTTAVVESRQLGLGLQLFSIHPYQLDILCVLRSDLMPSEKTAFLDSLLSIASDFLAVRPPKEMRLRLEGNFETTLEDLRLTSKNISRSEEFRGLVTFTMMEVQDASGAWVPQMNFTMQHVSQEEWANSYMRTPSCITSSSSVCSSSASPQQLEPAVLHQFSSPPP